MKTALLVDDYAPIRELLLDVLQLAFVGIEVKQAENLEQAIQWTQQYLMVIITYFQRLERVHTDIY